MRYYTEEEQMQAAERYIKEREQLTSLFPALCKVIRAFNGKVYNKRLESALRAETGKYIICKKNDLYITIMCGYTLATIKTGDLIEGKRIDAEKLIESATEYREKYLKQAEHMRQIIPTIETRRKQIEYIKNMLTGVLGDLDYTEKEIFGLNYSLRTY